MSFVLNREKKLHEIVIERDEGKITFICSIVDPKTFNKIILDNEVTEWDAPKGQKRKERFKDHDFYGVTIDKIDIMIVDWRGVLDEKNNPVPCTREMKEILFNTYPDIIQEVMDEVDAISEHRKKEDEEDRGNLKHSQTGKQRSKKEQ